MDAVADGEVQDIERLAELWLAGKVPNQPVYSDDEFAPVIGQGWFAEALAAWRALDVEPEVAPLPPPAPARSLWQRLRAWLGQPKPARAALDVGPAVAGAAGIVPPLPKPSAASTVAVPGHAPVD
jgi:hypothetical protein